MTTEARTLNERRRALIGAPRPRNRLVRLVRDVANPSPDRRTRHDFWLAETWPKGTRAVVKMHSLWRDMEPQPCIRVEGTGFNWMPLSKEQARVFLENTEDFAPVTVSDARMISGETDSTDSQILAALVSHGDITLDRLIELYRAAAEDWEAFDAGLKPEHRA